MDVPNEAQSTVSSLYVEACAKLDEVHSPCDAEPHFARFLYAVRESPEERPFVIGLFKQSLGPDEPWPWEFLQFCFHSLRWPELHQLVHAGLSRDRDNLRARSVWAHLLAAFDDDWEDAEFFREFRNSA
jgi:hypothetical protein